MELQAYDLLDVSQIFQSKGITNEIVWDISEANLEKMGLNIGQQIRYFNAVSKERYRNDHNTKGILDTFFGLLMLHDPEEVTTNLFLNFL